MKKLALLLFAGFSCATVNSQEVSDALRYAQDNMTGSARFRAMGGAFGAIGGELSSVTQNPASSALFANNQVGLSFNKQNIKNKANYHNTLTTAKEDNFSLNQAAGVFVFTNHDPNNSWKKISIGAGYENTNNYNNRTFAAGINPINSIDNYFLNLADGIPLGTLTQYGYRDLTFVEQQAYMGYMGFIINPLDDTDTNTIYNSNVPVDGSYYHENEVYTSGFNSKLNFNIATSYKDRLYFGANLNLHVTDFRRSSSFYEDNDSPLTSDETISKMRFNNELYTYGNGFSFQLGAIGKVTENFRLGFTYDSNTWYELYDETTQSLSSIRQAVGGQEITANVNPNVTNVYEAYKLQTPGKVTFSAAYLFGQNGSLSIDYGIKDYASSTFKPNTVSGFAGLNREVSNQLTSANELRIGGEYKIKKLSLRGGYRFEESPYKDGITVGDLKSYSGGLGYNFGGTKVDLAYSYTQRDSNPAFFSVGLVEGAKIASQANNVTLSVLFEL